MNLVLIRIKWQQKQSFGAVNAIIHLFLIHSTNKMKVLHNFGLTYVRTISKTKFYNIL